MIVYLAGLISTDHRTSLEWREEAAYRLSEKGLSVLSPLRGKDFSYSQDGGITIDDIAGAQSTTKDCVMRDYNDIIRAGVLLVNLNTWGSTRPMVGTLMELAWAWQLRKPVVAVCGKDDYLMREHPFIKDSVTHYCEAVEEAVEFVGRYYA